ncbi:peptide synthetase PhsB [Actinacidiphila yanglinensis]|uniref:Peptide synthetase PhsB n=1 Tax=Actinacidiphila yanglinensis TaxID=310779 RepID=A0A1H6EAB2_9ACTN|nr:condensation domain-containing protein [Actinacidiphila yanglinensis]SEG94211.1 peptide synthetase PhsB [Actinacidiphila yanglinensis]
MNTRDTRHAPDRPRQDSASYADRSPRGTVAALVRREAAWLLRRPVDLHDDIFDLGAKSLDAVRLAARVSKALGYEVPATELLAARRLDVFTDACLRASDSRLRLPPMTRLPVRTAPATEAQQRQYRVDKQDPDPAPFFIWECFEVTGALDPGLLEQAVQAVVSDHEVLRTGFAPDGDGTVWQTPRPAPAAAHTAVRDLASDDDETLAEAAQQALAQRFDWDGDDFLRLVLLRGPGRTQLLVISDHFVLENTAMNTVLDELTAHYRALTGEGEPPGPAPAIQALDHEAWKRSWAQSTAAERIDTYWREVGDGRPRLSRIVAPPAPGTAPASVILEHRLGPDADANLLAAAGSYGTFPLTVALATAAVAQFRTTGAPLLAPLLPVINRTAETMRLVGRISHCLPVPAEVHDGDSLDDVVRRTRQSLIAGLRHGPLPMAVRAMDEDPRPTGPQSGVRIFFDAVKPPRGIDLGTAVSATPVALPSASDFYWDLLLSLVEKQPGTFFVEARFDASRLDQDTVRSLLDTWAALLRRPYDRWTDTPALEADR